MKTFDSHKMHYIPVLLQDWLTAMKTTTPEVRESYAQRFEAIKEYCEYALELNEQKRNEDFKNRR